MYLTSGFIYDSAEQAEATFAGTQTHYQYTRFGNPGLTMLEERLALLEGAEACRVTATGMAAVHAALLSHLNTGDRIVASRALFGSCHWIVANLLPRYGIFFTFVDAGDMDGWRAALSTPAQMVLLETPSNPMLQIVDLAAVSALAHAAGAMVVVDNVFATPLLQRPLELGADVVVYSATKHMDGQGRVLGGAVLGRRAWIEGTLQPFIRNTGPALSPFNAWVLLKALETLPLRVEAACARAAALADFSGRGARRDPGVVSRAGGPSAARPGHAPDERGRHARHLRSARWPGRRLRRAECARLDRDLQQSGRQPLDGHPSRDDHAYAHRRGGEGEAGDRRRRDPPLRGPGGCGRSAGGSGASLGASIRPGPGAGGLMVQYSTPDESEAGRAFEARTGDILVRVQAMFVEDDSEPAEGLYVWAYRVAVENHGQQTVQLLRRTWKITDASGAIKHVHGEGVVGEQPVIGPGQAFEYVSGTPLGTPSGFMTGAYHLVERASGTLFDVEIPVFSLDSPHANRRVH